MKIPNKIQIAGRTYKIIKNKKISDKEHVKGRIYYDQCEILLNNDKMYNFQDMEISLIHECLHAIFYALDFEQDEGRVIKLSELLYQVIKQL